jgi:hypothetical protein
MVTDDDIERIRSAAALPKPDDFWLAEQVPTLLAAIKERDATISELKSLQPLWGRAAGALDAKDVEIERLRAVVDAAIEWNEDPGSHLLCLALADACDAFRDHRDMKPDMKPENG